MEQVSVSVIIPTWNRAEKLMRSVESVLAQTHEELECIVIDDGSTDDTKERIAEIKDERLRYYCLSENSGASRARNIGVEKARYDVIAFHDSDDLWRPMKLEKQIVCWQTQPESVMIYCAITYTDPESGEPVVFPFFNIPRGRLSGDMYEFLLHRNTIDTPTIMLKKEVFVKAGGFDPRYPSLEDWEFNIRVSRLGSIGYVDEPLVISAISEGSLSSSTSAYYQARCRLFAAYLDEIRNRGLFEEIAGDILRHAEHDGVLDSVKRMMMAYLLDRPRES